MSLVQVVRDHALGLVGHALFAFDGDAQVALARGVRQARVALGEEEPPAEKNTMSRPAKSAVEASSTTISRSANATFDQRGVDDTASTACAPLRPPTRRGCWNWNWRAFHGR